MACYEFESNRLASFQQYSGQKYVIELARKGYHWQNEGNKVACYRCGYSTANWDQLDDVVQNHRQFLRDCPVALQEDTTNKPMNILSAEMEKKLDNLINKFNCKINSIHLVHEDAADCENDTKFLLLCRNVVKRARKKGIINYSRQSSLIDLRNVEFEAMKNERTRLATFETWSPNHYALPADLARSGLFYTGSGDKVQCAFCRGFLFGWESGDVVSDEHKRHFPTCSFMRGDPVENVPIADSRSLDLAPSTVQLNKNTAQFSETELRVPKRKRDFSLLTQFQQRSLQRDSEDKPAMNKQTSRNDLSPKYFADSAGPFSDEDDPIKPQEGSGHAADDENEFRKLLDENQQLREIRTCKICLDKEVNVVFLPCGHLVSCDVCAPELRTCAVCRALIRGTVKVAF